MPLSKVSYPYPNDTLLVSNLLTTGTTVFSQVSKFAGLINENELGNGLYAGLGPFDNTPRLMFVPPGATTTAGNWQIDAQSAGTFRWFTPGITQMVLSDGRLALGTTPIAATLFALNRSADRVGTIVRGAVGQVADLDQIQNSAGSVLAYHRSDGYYFNTYGIGGSGFVHSGAFINNAQIASNVTGVNSVGILVRGIAGQVADLQQWQNSTPTTIAKIDNAGNFTVQNDNARIRAVRSTATAQTTGLGADSGQGFVGSESNTPFQIITNNTARLTLSADGTTATFTGAVIAPAATTAIPSLRAPHGTAPSAPTNGDIWTTTTGLFVRINGTTVSPILNPMTTQLQSTLAWNAADNQGQIYLNGATGNRLDWNTSGTAAPAFTTRSAGTKLVLYPGVGASSVDYAIGIESSNIWFSTASSGTGFKFYGGTTNIATLSGAGALTLSSSATATSFIPSGSTVPTNGMYLSAANTLNLSTNTTSRLVIDSSGNTSLSGSLTTGVIAINRSDASLEGGEIQLRRSVDNAVGFTIDVYGNNTSPDFRVFNSAGTQVLNFSTAGLLTVPSGLTVTSGTLSINGASPTIASTNASAATIFGATVTGVTIGSSTIKTTVYPAEPSGTTSGTVTQSAQLSGTKGMPINARGAAGVALAYTLAASDAGKMIYVSSTPTTPTITIPANSAVAFEIGTTIVVMNDIGAATNVSINITTDTLQLVSTGATGTRTLARYGMCTLVKVTATKWIITGNGVT